MSNNSFWGKLAGGALGLIVAGPWGAAVGLGLGHWADQSWSGAASHRSESYRRLLFLLAGRVAKADGRVSEAEVFVANTLMRQLGLDNKERDEAIRWFNAGKNDAVPLREIRNQLKKDVRPQPQLALLLLTPLVSIAAADGAIAAPAMRQLEHIANDLGIARWELERIVTVATQGRSQRPTTAASAYATLGVAKNASLDQIKKAYRRLMNRHHPDKLTARGATAEEISAAQQRTAEIRQAYELLKNRHTAKGT